ncbi:MAG: aminotransferase class I/II-fold pyridoxal phosphate-dependent enzyme [Bacteroidota bacterium]
MKIPHVEIFDWLVNNHEHAEYVLAFSNIKGLSKGEYDDLVRFDPGSDFDLGYNALYGAEELKEILAKMYGCGLDNIITTSGGSEANFLVFLATLDKDDEFIIEQPGYQPLWLTPKMLGARKVQWLRSFKDGFRLDLEALEGLITDKTKLIVLTNPHNPSGVLADRELEIRKAAEIARAKDIYVLIDEIFLDGAFIPQVSSYGLPNVIITGSMSKVYGLGGQRTGWIIGPSEITAKCQNAKAHTNAASSYAGELMNAHALRIARDYLVQRFKILSMSNLQVVKKWMDANKDIVEWVAPQGGIMCFPRYKFNMPSVELCHKLLNDYGVMLNPGEYFDLDGHIRLTYVCTENVLRKALEALGKGLREISGSDPAAAGLSH